MSLPMALPTKGQVAAKRLILTDKNRMAWKAECVEMMKAMALDYTLNARELSPKRKQEVVDWAHHEFEDDYPLADAEAREGLFADVDEDDDDGVEQKMKERTKLRAHKVMDAIKEAVRAQIEKGVKKYLHFQMKVFTPEMKQDKEFVYDSFESHERQARLFIAAGLDREMKQEVSKMSLSETWDWVCRWIDHQARDLQTERDKFNLFAYDDASNMEDYTDMMREWFMMFRGTEWEI